MWGWGFSYPLANAPEALVAIQRDYMMDAAPATLGYQVSFITNADEKRLVLRGTFHGSEADGKKLIAPLLKLPGATNEVDTMGTYYTLNEGLVDNPYVFPNIPTNASEDKIAGYCARLLDKTDWASVCHAAAQDKQGYAFANLEVMGCAIKNLPMHTSAYIHRDSYFDWAQDTFWTTEAEKADAYRFMDGMIKAWTPLLNGHANQDYPRRSQTNYRWLFFARAFNTLLFVKQKYDPNNFFHYQQSISPYPAGEEPQDHSKSLFSDPSIVVEPYSRKISG